MYIYLIFVATIVLGSINGSESRTGRILGGQVSQVLKYPYIVQLQHNYTFICGGSIISEDIILTAAHCVSDKMTGLKVRANATILFDENGMERNVEKVIIHEHHTQGEHSSGSVVINDIALLKLESPLKFGIGVWPIVMFNHNEVASAGSFGVVSGWGQVPELGTWWSNQLRSVVVPIINKAYCAQQYVLNHGWRLERGHICAGSPSKRDQCEGDSGGPLAVNDKLAGIVSGGYRCSETKVPSIYTDVAYYRHWIDDKINQLRYSW